VSALPPQFFDGSATGNALLNIGHERAKRIWDLHRNYFETFDLIITSDTAPLARVFLQNEWTKPLIIWICNRFDYCDRESLDCEFPDPEYYQLFREAKHRPNVRIAAYTAFEHQYTGAFGVDTGDLVIAPIGASLLGVDIEAVTAAVMQEERFFLPPYHNETRFMDLSTTCRELGIKNYCGHYDGPLDLLRYKGIIHLPYAWSNVAFFENMQLGIPYFIPSKEFVADLLNVEYYFQNALFLRCTELYDDVEWFSPEHRSIITYFDSWEDLKVKIDEADFPALRKKIKAHAKEHRQIMLERWEALFSSFN
jgi:hypothetical protein